MNLVEIYTDGSATIASKPGGYGWVLVVNGHKVMEGNGHMPKATNNDAEMEAAIQGMAAAFRFLMANIDILPKNQCEVHLRSDSQIVLNWANGTSAFKQHAKAHKYDQLRSLFTRLDAKSKWVRGHSGHEHNERCDKLANLGRLKLTSQDEIPSKKPVKKIKKIGKRVDGVICLFYKNNLKLVDLVNNLVEDYNPSLHGERSPIEVPE